MGAMLTYGILLVEDNPGDADLLTERLEDTPFVTFAVLRATTVAQALGVLAARRVDAVILDLHVPDSSGIETLNRIRPAADGAPIVVISGAVDRSARRFAIRQGAEDLMSKDDANSPLLAHCMLYVIERNRAREQYRQTARLLDATPDAILVVARSGLVRYVNDAALVLFNRRRDDFIDERLGFSVRDGEPVEITVAHSGDARVCEMRVVQFEWMNEPAFLVSVRDLTELKRAQLDASAKQQLAERRAVHVRRLLHEIATRAGSAGLPDVEAATVPILEVCQDDALTEQRLVEAMGPFESVLRQMAHVRACAQAAGLVPDPDGQPA